MGKAGYFTMVPALAVPDDFGFIASISVLSVVAISGSGSTVGVVASTALLTLMPEFFRFISDYKLCVYGALLFAVMRFAPGGLAGSLAQINAGGLTVVMIEHNLGEVRAADAAKEKNDAAA